MDFITNLISAHKDTLMNPVTWCIVIAVIGVIGYFMLMREGSAVIEKQIPQEQFVAIPEVDHAMDHGDHNEASNEETYENVAQEEATPYDSSESQHVEA